MHCSNVRTLWRYTLQPLLILESRQAGRQAGRQVLTLNKLMVYVIVCDYKSERDRKKHNEIAI